MRSKLSKLLHPICGRPMIGWVVEAARAAGAAEIVVVDAPGMPLRAHVDEDVEFVVQDQPLGTGHAVMAAAGHLDTDAPVVILNGDVPLITSDTIALLAGMQAETHTGAVVLTAVFDDPTGYGRVVRAEDGSVIKIVESKQAGDTTPEEMGINEINTGVYVFDGRLLSSALDRIETANAQGEYYLPDVLPVIRASGHSVTGAEIPYPEETFGVNDRVQLAAVRAIAQRAINDEHMRNGATIIDPAGTVIDVGVTLGQDVTIEPGTSLHGTTSVGDGSTIGPHSTLTDVSVGSESRVVHSYAVAATIGDRADVGPFAYLRPGTVLRERSKAGAFVEIKNSDIGARTKVPHLSYIGDATIGEDTNLGASTITANYDGYAKHRTEVGSRVHTSAHTTLVAPVKVGDDAYTGGGSAITEEIPDGALGIARPRQTNIEGYAERVRDRQTPVETHDTDR
jgi:bifunctional UDP-N-acetylglucosamine pyrophosphorylase / glucosamine-1-phosphate N-acetyltransferase